MSQVDSLLREPLINGVDKTYGKITEDIVRNTEGNPPKDWWIAFGFALTGFVSWMLVQTADYFNAR